MSPWDTVGIDHVVHVVNDLAEAGSFFEKLGFTVSGINTHPFGTQNRIVLFKDTYLELIAVQDAEKAGTRNEESFSFSGAVNDHAKTMGQGFHLLALKANSYETDKAQMERLGLTVLEPLHFARTRPDGTELKFTLFAAAYEGAETTLFHCWHETAHIFYAAPPEHENGARGISQVFFASESPADHHEYLALLTGQRDLDSSSYGVRFELTNGLLTVYSAPAHQTFLGATPKLSGPLLKSTAYEIEVEDLAVVKAGLENQSAHFAATEKSLTVGPESGFGATIRFSKA